MESKTYCVYMHINKLNGKKYIGITQQLPERRWANGDGYKYCKLFYRAIKKYGWDNFYHIVLSENLTKSQACNMEMAYIALHKTTNQHYGYNLTKGGEVNPMLGKHHSESTKQIISKKNKGKKHIRTKEYKQDVSKRKCKSVVCIELNIIFKSAIEASKYTNIDNGSIGKACRGMLNTAGGYHWKFLNPQDVDTYKLKSKRDSSHNATKVYCFETKKIYPSIKTASKELNVGSSSISGVCKGKRKSVNGYHFCYASEMEVE